jgi:protein TorT
MITGTQAYAEKAWYPCEVDVWQPPFNDTRQRVQKQYQPLDKAQKKWRVSVFIPHLKDAFWLEPGPEASTREPGL